MNHTFVVNARGQSEDRPEPPKKTTGEGGSNGALGWLWRLPPRAWIGLSAWIAAARLLPTVWAGFYTDDWLILAGLGGVRGAAPHGPWELYRLQAGGASMAETLARGPLPWWTSPEFRMVLFRPVTSFCLWLDHALSGGSAIWMHAVSVAWLALTVALAASVLFAVLPRRAATLAALLFALDESHVFSAGWISARHAHVSAALSLLALRLTVKGHGAARAALAAGLVALALGAGETGMAGAALVIGAALARQDTGRSEKWGRALSIFAVLGLWMAVYALTGRGVRGSGAYLDLSNMPGALSELPSRWLAAIGALGLGVPSDLYTISRPARPALAVIGLAATFGVGAALWSLRSTFTAESSSALRWAVPGAAAGALVASPGQLGDRTLVIPAFCAAVIWSVLITAPAKVGASRPWWQKGFAGAGGALHLVVAPLIGAALTAQLVAFGEKGLSLLSDPAIEDGRRTMVVVASDPMVSLFLPISRATKGADNKGYHVLSMAPCAHRAERLAEDKIALESDCGQLASSIEQVLRSPASPIAQGFTAERDGLRVRVARAQGGIAHRIEVTFDTGDWQIVTWGPSGLVRFDLPPVGEAVSLPWAPGPQGL